MTPNHAAVLEKQDAPHLAKYGLSSEPFTDTGSSDSFYADAEREQRLDLMQHLAPYSEILLVIGGLGTGKTTLLRQFVTQAGETWRTALVSAHAGMDREEFMTAIMHAFGLPMDASIPFERRRTVLIDHLHALRQAARMPILIVDDAHHLDPDAMELVLDLSEQNEGEHLLSTILVGTPQLQTLFATPALAPLQNRIAHTFDLPPLGESDTARYLRHRMRAAGAPDQGPFTPELASRIHAATGGVPAAINEMAHHVLTEQAGTPMRASHTVAEQPELMTTTAHRGIDKRWVAAAVASIAIVAVFVAGRFGGEKAPTERTASLSLPSEHPREESRVLREEAAPPTEAPPPAQVEPPAPAAGADLTHPLAAVTQKPEKLQSPAQPSTPFSRAGKTPPSAPPPAQPKPTKAPATNGSVAMASKGADWVRAQPPANSTLQLMALKDEQAVRQTIARHRLADAAYFPIQHDGRTLYVLIYGSYPSREAARRAATELPAGLISGQPWVRNFKALHKELTR